MTSRRSLTDDQNTSVTADGPRVLVSAPAGSGKTEVLTRRVIRLLDESRGESFRILAVTFTMKAADELRSRVERTVGDDIWRVDADTVHGFALEWIRRFGQPVGVGPDVFVYAQDVDRLHLLRRAVAMLPGEVGDSDQILRSMLVRIDRVRSERDGATLRDQMMPEDALPFHEVFDAYVAQMSAEGGIDFPGILAGFLDLLAIDPSVGRRFQRTYDHLLVDEGQDLTWVQAEILRVLAGDDVAVFVVADERQSIYAWAGGGIEWAHHLVGPQAHQLTLNHNFRCATEILALADQLATHFLDPVPAAETPPGTPPGKVCVRAFANERAEAVGVADWVDHLLNVGLDPRTIVVGESPGVAAEDIGLMARTRFALDAVETEMRKRGVRVSIQTDAAEMLGTPEARLFHALLEMRANPTDRPAMRRAAEEIHGLVPDVTESASLSFDAGEASGASFFKALAGSQLGRLSEVVESVPNDADGLDLMAAQSFGLSSDDPAQLADVERLQDWWSSYRASTRANYRSIEGFVRYLFRVQRTRPDDPGVRLLTVHRAKGLEFRAAAVLGLTEGSFPDYRSVHSPAKANEERRAFYVAVVRASRSLLLTWPRRITTRYGNVRSTEPSRFIAEGGRQSDETC